MSEPITNTSSPPAINLSSVMVLDNRERVLVYVSVVPVLLFLCTLAALINVCICVSARHIRRPLSVTQYLSLSLAGADASAATILGIGLLINSLLPVVYGVQLDQCWALTTEAFRLGGVISTAWHLLALAINHYVGIARPLHYAHRVTRRRAREVIVLLWIVPILFFFGYFAAVGGLALGSCSINFILYSVFRRVVASLFFVPLACMVVAYSRIFILIRRHQRNSFRLQSGMLPQSRSDADRSGSAKSHSTAKPVECSVSTNVAPNVRSNIKAVVTTLLILGTYITGWLPAVVSYLLICADCVYHPDQFSELHMLTLNIAVNTLIVLKCLVDPIIYTARMPDILRALRVMFHCVGDADRAAGNGSVPLQRTAQWRSLRTENISVRANCGSAAVHRQQQQSTAAVARASNSTMPVREKTHRYRAVTRI